MSDATESGFHAAMLGIYDAALSEVGYRATRFRQMVNERGGLETARILLASSSVSDGYTELWMKKRLDLTVEALVLQGQWRSLFEDSELEVARRRLLEYGYAVDG